MVVVFVVYPNSNIAAKCVHVGERHTRVDASLHLYTSMHSYDEHLFNA